MIKYNIRSNGIQKLFKREPEIQEIFIDSINVNTILFWTCASTYPIFRKHPLSYTKITKRWYRYHKNVCLSQHIFMRCGAVQFDVE